MAPASSEPGSDPLARRAALLLAAMAAGALACVGTGLVLLWWAGGQAGLAERVLGLATRLVVVAPLVSLIGVALSALRDRRRLALLALATLVVTLVGMGLAR